MSIRSQMIYVFFCLFIQRRYPWVAAFYNSQNVQPDKAQDLVISDILLHIKDRFSKCLGETMVLFLPVCPRLPVLKRCVHLPDSEGVFPSWGYLPFSVYINRLVINFSPSSFFSSPSLPSSSVLSSSSSLRSNSFIRALVQIQLFPAVFYNK